MRSGAKVLVICTAAVLAIAASANADVIAYWHFNDVTAIGGTNDLLRINPLGTAGAQTEYARDFGIGVAEITVWGTADPSEGNLTGTNGGTPNNNFGSFAGSSLNALNGAGGGGSLTIVGATGNNGHYFLIELDDAIGTCVLTYATRGTSTGFSTHTIDYSTDNGATWMNAAVITGRTSTTWSVQTIDFMDLFAGTYGHESNLIRITVSGASGDGGNNRFDNIQINGALLTPGRCCADGACSITIKPDCDAIGGSWTDFGTCAGSPCTTGSCCHHDGTCQVTLQADCTGTWSAGTTCTPNTCPQPTGSCCHTDGTCAVTLQADCTGTWTMDGVCDPNPCPQPPGACCTGTGCTEILKTACDGAGGVWFGPLTTCANGCPTYADVVISEIYGDGGYSGSLYTHDYIELFNRGTASVDMTGWSVQYASATGAFLVKTDIPAGVILLAGQHYLIQEALSGTGGTHELPTPDVSGNIDLSYISGKVALVNSQTLLAGVPSTGIVDLVGYGAAGAFEGRAVDTSLITAATQILRLPWNDGCIQTHENYADFIVDITGGARNSTAPRTPCNGPAADGACCDPNIGGCTLLTETDCLAQSGNFLGLGTSCAPLNPCAQPMGACCTGRTCAVMLPGDCANLSGAYQGDGTACSPNPCPTATAVVVSQVYGGGGNSGSTYRNDFIELYNRSASPVNVNGWSVQYISAAGTGSWQVTSLTDFTIDPGQYYLVQEARGAGGTTDLPPPDAIGTIAMSATAGRVALVNSTTALTSCTDAGIMDLIGYGTAATCSETAPTGNLSNTTAALRNGSGSVDTDRNNLDFTIGPPNPRSSGEAPACMHMGDLNGSTVADGLDIQCFVNCVIGGAPPTCNCACGDFVSPAGVGLEDIADFVATLLGN